MSAEPIDDIEAWSATLSGWRRDCLRRLAISPALTQTDLDELLAMIRSTAGLTVASPPPAAIPFQKTHYAGAKTAPITLKGISGVQNVNRLVSNASLTFCPKALTIVYGRNGSGKSGFVRIMRTACRTRVENPATLKVLGDVYGGGTGPQSANIIVDLGSGDVPVAWISGAPAVPELSSVAVFDTASAALYVDSGSQIRYLPFGLALPHRLNTVNLALKEKLETARSQDVGNKVSLTTITFSAVRDTVAQKFDRALSAKVSFAEIDTAASFADADQKRLDAIVATLSASTTQAADVGALAAWVGAVKTECVAAAEALSDEMLVGLTGLYDSAISKRKAAEVAGSALFTDEPLPNVGSESWRTLWEAARDYSIKDAYPELPFPVVTKEDSPAECVLCQQPLGDQAADRMERFRSYMDDTLDAVARTAEAAVSDAITNMVALKQLGAEDFNARVEQVRQRDPELAKALEAFATSATGRRANALQRLKGEDLSEVTPLASPIEGLGALEAGLIKEKEALADVGKTEARAKLETERAELEDRKILAANKARLITRRDLKKLDAAYAKALTDVQPIGITKKANELIDKHLTAAVTSRFDTERTKFEIMHLNVALARKSGQTKAEFGVSPQTALAKVSSEILSEGEQRALALAGFLTEVALTDGTGPIIVDDPVSSLDRDRSNRVAARIVEEAGARQVVVFTHDIVFFNELCRAADEAGVEPVTVALYADASSAGRVDGAGMVWKGLNVKSRIGRLKNDFAPLPKLRENSPSDYEVAVKNLYGRLRDTYERMVEEVIFCDIVRRGVDVVQTQMLRFVTLPDDLALRFHEGMTRANTHSHDNPASDTVPVPSPDDFNADIAAIEALVTDFKTAKEAAEASRPSMKPKK